jgi:DNA-binding MarR family transcriptional regulator
LDAANSACRCIASGNLAREQIIASLQIMFGNVSPSAIAARFNALADRFGGSTAADRAEQAQRKLMGAVASRQPATLNQVADAVGRGAPAVSRAVETLVRAGLVERTHDPDNRRRLALRLSEKGQEVMRSGPASGSQLASGLERLAQSELRAIERAVEILERLPG